MSNCTPSLSLISCVPAKNYICFMATILIKSATLINEGKQTQADVFIKDGFIEKIAGNIDVKADKEINAEGLYLFPGCIDDQVHFRQPGLTHKGDIASESRALWPAV